MNLSGVYRTIRVPRAVEYKEDATPLKLWNCLWIIVALLNSKDGNYANLLNVFKKFVDWARFKLESSKAGKVIA